MDKAVAAWLMNLITAYKAFVQSVFVFFLPNNGLIRSDFVSMNNNFSYKTYISFVFKSWILTAEEKDK